MNDYIAGGSRGGKARSSTEATSFEEALHTHSAYDDVPTEEERNTLRLVADKIPYTAWLIALVEFGEQLVRRAFPAELISLYRALQPSVPPTMDVLVPSATSSSVLFPREVMGQEQRPPELSSPLVLSAWGLSLPLV